MFARILLKDRLKVRTARRQYQLVRLNTERDEKKSATTTMYRMMINYYLKRVAQNITRTLNKPS